MATLNKDNLHTDTVHAGEYGSESRATKSYTGQLAIGDIVHLIRLPANTDLNDATLFHGAAGGTAAGKVGYVPTDPANGVGDDDYFVAAGSVVAAGRKRADSALKPIRVPYAVDIIFTATAAFAASAEITVSAQYEWRGR